MLAKRQRETNPKTTFFAIETFLGRRHDDPRLEQYKSVLPYPIVEGPNRMACAVAHGRSYSGVELLASVVQKIKKEGEETLGKRIREGVIAVPAYFDVEQRQALLDATEVAGVDVVAVIDAPTAAAQALVRKSPFTKLVAVYHLGGTGSSISILSPTENGFKPLSVKVNTVGAIDLDLRLADYLAAECKNKEGVDLKRDCRAFWRLLQAAEEARDDLVNMSEIQISLPGIAIDPRTGSKLDFTTTVTSDILESVITGSLELIKKPCLDALSELPLKGNEISEVIVIADVWSMDKVGNLMGEAFGEYKYHLQHPEEAIARGAAIESGPAEPKRTTKMVTDEAAATRAANVQRLRKVAENEWKDQSLPEARYLAEGMLRAAQDDFWVGSTARETAREYVEKVDAAVADLRKAMSGPDVGEINRKTDLLRGALLRVGEALYHGGKIPMPSLWERCRNFLPTRLKDAIGRLAGSIVIAIDLFSRLGRSVKLVIVNGWRVLAAGFIVYFLFLYCGSLGLDPYIDTKKWGALFFGAFYFWLIYESFRSQSQLDSVETHIDDAWRLGHKRRRKVIRQQEDRIAGALNSLAVHIIVTTMAFYFSSYLWYQVDPTIYVASNHSQVDVALFVVDLFLRGSLLDVMEHFKLAATVVRPNHDNLVYLAYAFTYRVYVPIFIIAAIVRYLRLMHEVKSLEIKNSKHGDY
jgi:hypothetical protein